MCSCAQGPRDRPLRGKGTGGRGRWDHAPPSWRASPAVKLAQVVRFGGHVLTACCNSARLNKRRLAFCWILLRVVSSAHAQHPFIADTALLQSVGSSRPPMGNTAGVSEQSRQGGSQGSRMCRVVAGFIGSRLRLSWIFTLGTAACITATRGGY
jgi:hypothetical protein